MKKVAKAKATKKPVKAPSRKNLSNFCAGGVSYRTSKF